MSSLLSTPDTTFVIENNGKRYSFIDEINPSGGNNTKQESTGVITRFTIRQSNSKMANFVKVMFDTKSGADFKYKYKVQG